MEEYANTALSTHTNSFGERYIFELSQQLFEEVNSQTVFFQNFYQNELLPDSFYVVGGTDSGLLTKFFLGGEIPDTTRVVFVELPEAIQWLKKHNNYPQLPDNVSIVDYSKFGKQLEEYAIYNYILQDKFFYVQSLGIQHCFYKPYVDLSTAIHDYLDRLHWNIRIDLDQRGFIVGPLENVAENKVPCSLLYGKFRGKTAVLLAGGPSLDDILPWVVLNRDKLVVFAVSRIARQLLNHNVSPDFFITVNTQPLSFEVCKQMLLFHKESILINHTQACPQLISQWWGKSCFMGHILPWPSKLNGPSKDLIGPTVSHAAYEIIIKFGFSKIILGGIDLCYTAKNWSYAQGSLEAEQTVQVEGGDVKVETNDGHLVETTFAIQRGILEFGKMVLNAKKNGVRTLNPSLLSAKIDGVEVVALNDIKLRKDAQLTNIAQQELSVSHGYLKEHYSTILTELRTALDAAKYIRDIAANGFQTATVIDQSDDLTLEEKVNTCESFMSKLSGAKNQYIFDVITSFGIHFFNSLQKPRSIKSSESQDSLLFFKLYFTAVISSIDKLSDHIEKAIKRTSSRQEEIAIQPDIESLITQWQADNQIGRTGIFLDNYAEEKPAFAEHTLAHLHKLKDDFLNSITSEEDAKAESEWSEHRLDQLRNRILHAFKLKDSSTLGNLISSLNQESSEATITHFHLVSGLYHELQGQTQDALTCYNQIVGLGEKSPRNVLEDSLSRITSISISTSDLANAQLALQCLADLSVDHMPTYAEFLYLAGQKELALEIYADYLGKAPEDLKTMLKLGQIYKEMNSKDGVKMIVDYVLKRDPHNQTALNLKNSI